MGLFDKIISTSVESLKSKLGNDTKEKTLKKEEYFVAGTAYNMSNIKKLAISNPDWKSTKAKLIKDGKANDEIYRYNYVYKPVKLVPEPANKYDPNAVMVMIAGEKVGYITRDDNKKVNHILKKADIKYISAFIYGGEYKFLDKEGNFVKEERPIGIKVRIAYVE